MRERDIENYLRDRIKKVGGIAYKFESPGNVGVPDRLILLPGGEVHFIELKAPGRKPTKNQTHQHKRFERLGSIVHVIDSKQGVDEWIDKMVGASNAV
ncbi:VRR-NUC domain-containing protein [Geomicrobium sediminis]|uniref:VRR-NUC domain-containing protein n=1 Tax=Geomicrobium sediminis TaxID=1347788 RepID=A0ABS2P6T7_9BACL|nr:VRR-NUC domain-containing protein [Geomicrobium sediminis]MBM7631115.1 hypothetical protein [Geomicrobium sediminis]